MATWIVHLEGGPRRVNHAGVAIGQRVFSFGGYCTGEDYETARPIDVHVLNLVTFRWHLLPLPAEGYSYDNAPYQRYGHTAVAYREHAYIWGGRNDKEGACDILFCFDTGSFIWSQPEVYGQIPSARDGHSSCVLANRMYIFGGYEEKIARFSNDLHFLDFKSWCWNRVQPASGAPPSWRDFHTATPIGHQIYIFGGRSDRGGDAFTNREIYSNQIYIFNILTESWNTLDLRGYSPVGRRSHSAFEYGGCLYVFGGYNGIEDKHFADMHRFDPELRKWTQVEIFGYGPLPRRRQCCCVLGSRVFLFGGTSPKHYQSDQPPSMESDLQDHSDLFVLDFSPSLKLLCLLKVLKYKLDRTSLPQDLRWELTVMTTNNAISRPLNNNG